MLHDESLRLDLDDHLPAASQTNREVRRIGPRLAGVVFVRQRKRLVLDPAHDRASERQINESAFKHRLVFNRLRLKPGRMDHPD